MRLTTDNKNGKKVINISVGLTKNEIEKIKAVDMNIKIEFLTNIFSSLFLSCLNCKVKAKKAQTKKDIDICKEAGSNALVSTINPGK